MGERLGWDGEKWAGEERERWARWREPEEDERRSLATLGGSFLGENFGENFEEEL